jgi:hypothetical protein
MSLLGRAVMFLLSAAGGGFLVLVGAGYLRNYRDMRGDPADVRQLEAGDGPVELVGRAREHGEPLRSPFTDTPTLVAEWQIQEYTSSGSTGNKDWSSTRWDEHSEPFVLDTDTGRVVVEPGGAQLNVDESDRVEVAPEESPPAGVAEFVDDDEHLERESRFRRRFRESRIDPGDEVHVLGPVRTVAPDPTLPRDVDAVVGVENHEERTIQVGEDDLAAVRDKAARDGFRFVLTRGGEADAERRQLRNGLVWAATGGLVAAGGMAAAVFAPTAPPFF